MPRSGFMLCAAVTAIGAAGCGSSSTNSTTGGGSGGGSVTVNAHDFAFDPVSGTLAAGSTVTVSFVNAGAAMHSLTLDSGGAEVIAAGGETKTLSFTAPASGSASFHCKFHASMHGTIGSSAGGGAASSGSSSSGGGGYGNPYGT